MKYVYTFLAFVLMSSGFAQVPGYVPNEGLVAWYPLNGSANDLSGNSFHGTTENVTMEVDRFGNFDGALGFQGQNCCGQSDALVQDIRIEQSILNLGDDYTVVCWFKSSSLEKYQQCLFNSIPHTGFAVEYNNEHATDVTTVGLGPGDAYWNTLYQHGPFSSYVQEEWYHVAFIKSGNDFKLFVNGDLDWAESYEFANTYDLEVGIRFGSIGGGHQLLNGAMDDCGVWERALSDEEILTLYNAPAPMAGCTDDSAFNYDPAATEDDGSCVFNPCFNATACNFDPELEWNEGPCVFAEEGYDCDGNCLADDDGNGICDELDGCTDPAACNFMPAATEDDGSCVMQPQEIWQGEQLFSLEEELALAVSGVDHVIWSDNMTENPLTVVESGTYGFTMVNGDLNEMSQSVSTGPGSCGVIEAGSDWKSDQFTVGLWLKLDNANRGYILMEGDDGWPNDFGLALQCIDGFIELDVNHLNLGLSSVNLNDGNWHAVHVMYNGSAIQLHIDGALNMDVPFEDTIDQNDWPFVLGSKKSYECTTDDGSGSVFEGSLSRLSIWSRTLEPWELMESITCGERFVGESLVGHWPLDGSGASDELVALAGEAGVNHDMAVVEDSPVGSCSRCATSDWVEVVLATDLCGEGTVWDASAMTCVVANPSDTDFDGCVSMTDLLDLLTVFGTCLETESESEPLEWSCGDPLGYQGYDYETVQIGAQCWFAENLRNENFNDGTPINFISENSDWSQSWETASYCLPSPNGHANAGLLYNKWAAIHPAVCPTNWHISSHQEWIDFELFLGLPEELSEVWGQFRGETGRAMKSSADWDGEPSLQSGFNAVPSPPRRGNDGSFQDADVAGFWTSTSSESGAWYRALMGAEEGVTGWNDGDAGRFGFALRCIQDSE